MILPAEIINKILSYNIHISASLLKPLIKYSRKYIKNNYFSNFILNSNNDLFCYYGCINCHKILRSNKDDDYIIKTYCKRCKIYVSHNRTQWLF